MHNAADLIASLRQIHGAKFVSFTYRSKETNELARYVLILGVDFAKMYAADRETLTALMPSLEGLHKDAAEAVMRSITDSLTNGLGNNAAYTHGPEQGNTYESIAGAPGLKINMHDGSLHVVGMLHRKDVIEEGQHKTVNSRPLTIAKREVERHLRRSKIRQFKFPNILTAKLNGETLELSA